MKQRKLRISIIFFLFIIWNVLLFSFSGCSDKENQDQNREQNQDDRIIIVLIDTGISTTAIDSDRILPGHNYVRNSEDTEDRINHGTAVASTIVGSESAQVEAAADFVYLVPLVIADRLQDSGNDPNSDSEQAGGDEQSDDAEQAGEAGQVGESNLKDKIQQVDADTLGQVIRDAIDIYHADLINMSLGTRTDSEELKSAAEYARKKGVLIISAVGNGGEKGELYYPAAYESVLAVGSCDKKGEESYFSQDGADVLAPGEGILLASKNGFQYGVRGTSFATGYVSAYAANLLNENPGISVDELQLQVIDDAKAQGGCLARK